MGNSKVTDIDKTITLNYNSHEKEKCQFWLKSRVKYNIVILIITQEGREHMNYKVGVISGDGIGPEIVREAKKILDKVGTVFGHTFSYDEILMGGVSIDAVGVPLTDDAVAQAKAADAVLMGSIGGNTTTSPWYKLPPDLRPEAGLLKLRKALNLFANLRPAYLYEELIAGF